MLARLQQAGRRDLGDFMTFEIGPDEDHPDIRNEGMQYEGKRFRAECRDHTTYAASLSGGDAPR